MKLRVAAFVLEGLYFENFHEKLYMHLQANQCLRLKKSNIKILVD